VLSKIKARPDGKNRRGLKSRAVRTGPSAEKGLGNPERGRRCACGSVKWKVKAMVKMLPAIVTQRGRA